MVLATSEYFRADLGSLDHPIDQPTVENNFDLDSSSILILVQKQVHWTCFWPCFWTRKTRSWPCFWTCFWGCFFTQICLKTIIDSFQVVFLRLFFEVVFWGCFFTQISALFSLQTALVSLCFLERMPVGIGMSLDVFRSLGCSLYRYRALEISLSLYVFRLHFCLSLDVFGMFSQCF